MLSTGRPSASPRPKRTSRIVSVESAAESTTRLAVVVGMNADRDTWTGSVSERLRCCICGGSTGGADDYVLLELTAAPGTARQFLGAHADHLNAVLAEGFRVEVNRM